MRIVKAAIRVVSMLAIVPAAYAQFSDAKNPGRPNVIIILLDDMGFSDFGSFGGEIPTPNIDRLAANGIRFNNFYNNARCSPSRAALLTGLNPHQAGMGYLPGKELPDARGTLGRLHERSVTIAQLLQQNGYFTAMAGKWHLTEKPYSSPDKRGFDRSLSAAAGGIYHPDQLPKTDGEGANPEARKRLFLDGRKLPTDDLMFGKYWYGTDLWTRWGIRFIDEARAANKPFFLYLAHVAPHFPLMAPEEDIARFRGKFMAGWDELRRRRYARQQAMGLIGSNGGLPDRMPTADAWDSLTPANKKRFDEMMAIYAAALSRVDRSIGDLTAHLEKTGQLDNSIIMIMSDNGGNAEGGPDGRTGDAPWGGPKSNVFVGMNWAMLQNTPFRMFKHFTHEGGIATPLIMHWPQAIAAQRRGTIDKTPSHLIDMMPTILQATGASYPARYKDHNILPMEGMSLIPALDGRSPVRRQPLFWEHEGNRAVRDGRWKAVYRLGGNWELYDLHTDRTELQNLARKYPDRLKALATQWDDWAARAYVDPWDEASPRADWGGPSSERSQRKKARKSERQKRKNR